MSTSDNRVYQALALPDDALSNGGVEILRAGLINNELYVSARRAFKDPATWGEILAEIARRIALYYSAEDTALTEKEALTEIEQAFAADLGAHEVKSKPAPRVKSEAKTKATARAKPSKVAKKKSTRAASKRKKR